MREDWMESDGPKSGSWKVTTADLYRLVVPTCLSASLPLAAWPPGSLSTMTAIISHCVLFVLPNRYPQQSTLTE